MSLFVYVFVAIPAPILPKNPGPFPQDYGPATGCRFSFLRGTEVVPHLDFGVYKGMAQHVHDYFPNLGNDPVFGIPFFTDYSIWPVPFGWGGADPNGHVQGWYGVGVPANGTTVRIEGPGLQVVQNQLIWDEAAEEEGLPTFGIVAYPEEWYQEKPWPRP
jgi:hypothetical protein